MFVWFTAEWKRAAAMLPALLQKIAIFAILCVILGIIVCGVGQVLDDNTQKETVRIGYVAPEDMLTKLAVSYVEQLESVKSWCSLEKTTVDKGMELLERGALTALLVLPDDLVNEILTGSNAPVMVYLPKSVDASVTNSKIFEELANAGVGMLQTAQAEIYAAEKLVGEIENVGIEAEENKLEENTMSQGSSKEKGTVRKHDLQVAQTEEYAAEILELGQIDANNLLQEMYNDINRLNLSIALTREKLWNTLRLSVTGNHTYAVYYGSAFFTLYLLVSSLFFGRFCKRDKGQQCMAVRRLGIPYGWQLLSQLSAMLVFMILTSVLPFGLLFYPPLADVLTTVFTVKTVAAVFLSAVLAAVYALLVYQLVAEHQRAVLVLGILALAQGYAAGCLVPSVLLPQGIATVGAFLPAAYIKATFTMLFTGNTQNFADIVLGLVVWSSICFMFAWLVIRMPEWNYQRSRSRRENVGELREVVFDVNNVLKSIRICQDEKRTGNVNAIFWILLKRLFYQKSVWVCLGLVVLLSAAAVYIENRTETSIVAAVYDADGRMGDVLTQYHGLVDFVLCDSEEQVKQMVLRDKAECGYILPEQILEDMVHRKADGSIIVYEDGDAVAARIVDEVLFQKLFHRASLQWFEGYIAEKLGNNFMDNSMDMSMELSMDISIAVEEQIAKEKTFAIQIERIGEEKIPPAFPARLLVVGGVLLCAFQGVAQALVDIHKKRFYKYNRAIIVMITILQPVVMGMLAGGVAFAMAEWIGKFG